ncbi:MAG: restriction endonuclease subunit M, partial [Promicromonosporaceae bacterium]|nr:restriction endonuclease subunit M [Promicromonosporaceae bacterium]
PPFNSKRNYSVIFNRHDVHTDVSAQIQAFEDTWSWDHRTELAYEGFIAGGLPERVADALAAFRILLGRNDGMAYLVNMAPRLVELHRVLKPTGSLWLHCDPTMSHYIKVLLDAIFDVRNMRNEVIWQRTGSKGYQSRRLPNNHDVILVYGKSSEATWNTDAAYVGRDLGSLDPKTLSKYSHIDDDGRRYRLDNLTGPNAPRPNLTYEFLGVTKRWRWTRERMQEAYEAGLVVQTAPGRVPQQLRYLDEQRGVPLSDVWTDIPPLNSQAAERLDYPTQKPVALLERIISLASNPGEVVLDPFAGCGTTVDAAQKLGRQWIGIDITYIAIDLIVKRLIHTYGASVMDNVEVSGLPRDLGGAAALLHRDPFEFERWAVSQIDARPNDRQGGDRGIDGEARFILPTSRTGTGRVLVSVKGGTSLNPAMVRDLIGTVNAESAELGLLITLREPTAGTIDAANKAGYWTHPANGQTYPRIQIATVSDLLASRKPNLPAIISPYLRATRRHDSARQALSTQGALI